MKLQRLLAISRKEFIHIIRDPRSLGMGIVIPIVLLLLFGYALALDVDRVPIVVWDQDYSSASRDLVSRFEGSRYFSIVARAVDYRSIERSIDRRDSLAALVIPPGFGSNLARGRTATIQLIVDGSDANTAAIATGYADAIVTGHSQRIAIERADARGARLSVPLELQPRVWYNEELESRNYIVPGLIAVIMMIIAALLTSLTIAREWETGTMEQLISTPVRGVELIVGKLVPYFAIGMLDVAIVVALGIFLFRVPFRGSLLLLVASSAIFLIGALSQGILISIITRGQLLASQAAMISTFLPAFLLSGFMYDIANMPRPLQVITHAISARYFITLLKGIFLKGIGLEFLLYHVLLLTLFGAVLFALANARFKKKLEV
jgi:ABC-2 type transport system permease protein